MEAAIEPPKRSGSSNRTRALVGTAALAVAVTIPDISLGAIAAPYARIDLGEQVPPLPANVWTPTARPTGPAYAPLITAREVAPVSLTFAAPPGIGGSDRAMPVGVLEGGSDRFDLAFADVALPNVEQVSLTPHAPPAPLSASLQTPTLVGAMPPPRAHLVAVPQISLSDRVRPESESSLGSRTGALESRGSGDAGAAATNSAIEAAFAGAIDASSAVRGSIPVSPGGQPAIESGGTEPVQPAPVRAPAARAIAPRGPNPAVGASAAAQTELVVKSRLDARINGVLAGSVEFRQLDGTIAISLRSVVDMMHERFSASEIERLRTGQAINSFITLSELQAAGIPIRYNAAYDEVEFGIDYEDAPNAAKVQVQQIGAPTFGTDRVGIDQIPRR